jgi:predicted nucleic acid-binding protein
MTNPSSIRVFADSDVIISSLLSTSGAAYALLHTTQNIELFVSNFSIIELKRVVDRLNLDQDALHETIGTLFNSVEIGISYKEVQAVFADYTRDADDAHIVAGAKEAKATHLVSYNLRHFEAEKIERDFQITLLTPGLFLQYLRSL